MNSTGESAVRQTGRPFARVEYVAAKAPETTDARDIIHAREFTDARVAPETTATSAELAPVAVIRLARPPVNAIDRAMQADLLAAVAEIAGDPAVRCVVIYGGDRAFAAGADIKEMASQDAHGMREWGAGLSAAVDAVAALRVPVVAAVCGFALGGGLELALAADFRVVATDARLGLPEVNLGVMPGAGGTQRLPRLIGVARTKELIFSGRLLDGDEAIRVGLASRALPVEQVLPEALKWATQLAAGPTKAFVAAKRAIDRGIDLPLPAGLALEAELFLDLFGTEDQRIGMESFLAKGPRPANFTGR